MIGGWVYSSQGPDAGPAHQGFPPASIRGHGQSSCVEIEAGPCAGWGSNKGAGVWCLRDGVGWGALTLRCCS